MSWQDRVLPEIELTSPDGNSFTGLFQDSTVSNSKKLGVFSYPGIDGEIIQDLGLNADRYSFSVIFAGDDHDLRKREFQQAIKERGPWTVNHPTIGFLLLQIESYSVQDAPVSNGGYSQFDISWVEPLTDEIIISVAEQRNIIERLTDAVNNSMAVAFVNNIDQTIESATQAIRDITDDIIGLSKAFLNPLSRLSNTIYNLELQIQRSINETLGEAIISAEALVGQLQQLIQTPVDVVLSAESKIAAYEKFIAGGVDLSPEIPTVESKNRVSVQESTLSSALAAICLAAANSEIKTRKDATQIADKITFIFSEIVKELDATQSLYDQEFIDKQYFSQSDSFGDLQELVSATLKYLTSLLFNLAIEKRFKLERPKTPVQVVIEEYGSLGENDINLDIFIDINSLKGDEIILLPAGKEVVVYVS